MSTFLPATDLTARVGRDACRIFGGPPDGVWAAPGRVNLIGEHTDYNEGFCLPVALAHRTFVAVVRRDDDRVQVTSRQSAVEFTGRIGEIGPGWTAYPTGVLWALREAGVEVTGMQLYVDSAVPVGAGLSSSAALTCAVALAASAPHPHVGAEQTGSRADLVRVCMRAENEAVGAPTGGMDQVAALLAEAGTATLLDCRDFSTAALPLRLDDAGVELLIIDTRAAHDLGDGQYGRRRSECEAAVVALGVRSPGVTSLRDATLEQVEALRDPLLRRRARHVVTEIARAQEFAELLRAGRLTDTGPLMDASHTSLRDDYQVSCAELDVAVAAARRAGAVGARMTGGGFGGSALALVPSGRCREVAAAVDAAYAARGWRRPWFVVAEPSGAAEWVA